MSWSVSLIGKRDALIAALKAKSEKESGQCKVEYDAALPLLVGAIEQTFVQPEALGMGYREMLIQVDASGSGTLANGVEVQRHLNLSVKPIYTTFVQ